MNFELTDIRFLPSPGYPRPGGHAPPCSRVGSRPRGVRISSVVVRISPFLLLTIHNSPFILTPPSPRHPPRTAADGGGDRFLPSAISSSCAPCSTMRPPPSRDPVGLAHGGQAVGDDELVRPCSSRARPAGPGARSRCRGAGGLVEDQDGGSRGARARWRSAASGRPRAHAALADHRLVALGHPAMKSCALAARRRFDLGVAPSRP